MRIYHNITDDDQMVKACQPLINEIPKHLHRPSPPFANFTASTTLSTCAMFAVFPSLEISTLSSLLAGSGDSRSSFQFTIVSWKLEDVKLAEFLYWTFPRCSLTQQLNFLGRGMSTGGQLIKWMMSPDDLKHLKNSWTNIVAQLPHRERQ